MCSVRPDLVPPATEDAHRAERQRPVAVAQRCQGLEAAGGRLATAAAAGALQGHPEGRGEAPGAEITMAEHRVVALDPPRVQPWSAFDYG